MRILTVTNLYPTPFQPQRATFNREQVKALARDHAVSVIAPIAWTEELAARRAGAPPLPPGRRTEWDGVPVEYPRVLFIPRVLRGLYGRFYQWSAGRAFHRAVAAFQPNVVFATWAYPDGWAAVRLAHRAGLPVVLKVHGSDVLQLDEFPARRRGTVAALRGADRVVAVSRDLAQKVGELGADPGRVHLVYNGVDADVFHPGNRAEARRQLGLDPVRPAVLYVGNLLPVKGPDILIDACARLAGRGVGFDLHVIGKGPLRPTLERQAADRGIGDRVRFHGVIAHDRLPVWFRAASLLALPSRSEGVPNVLLEAAACGTPFVASRVGGVPEVAHLGASRLAPPGDPDGLADAIATTITAPAAPAAPGRVGRTQADVARDLTAIFEAARGTPAAAAGTVFRPDEALVTA
ncbi:MAG TPA: glycosyltransferase [Urbifossiella sp.]|jgi:glycosyltransferase involved in cell wall biosynthesis|nr:glycosyltransferase [Urbifossiella sp.]